MDLFGRDDHQSNQHESCVCEGMKGVFLSNRHMSWAVSTLLLFNFFIFMSGYFLGKKKVVDQLNQKLDQETLTDHVYSSMYALYDSKAESDVVEVSEFEVVQASLGNEVVLAQSADTESHDTASIVEQATETVEAQAVLEEDLHAYYAQLVGFGTERAAQQFVKKLAQRDIAVYVKKRPSKTAKGRTIYWYQVVTEAFTNKDDLMTLVDDIKRRERLHDVRIVSA